MADAKLTALSAIGTLDAADLFYVVDDVAGTPTSAKATGTQLHGLTKNPLTDDGQGLGTAALRWADLFLAEGGVINWDNGDFTATQAGNVLAFQGGDVVIGHNGVLDESRLTVAYAGNGITIAAFSADGAATPFIFSKSRNATPGAHTVLQADDLLGEYVYQGSDGTDYARGGVIACRVDGTPGNDDMPGRIMIYTSRDGTQTPVEGFRLDKDGNVNIGSEASASRRFHVNETNSTTNAVTYVEQLQVKSSGSPAAGIGAGMEFVAETAADNHEILGTFEISASDVTATSEDGRATLKLMRAGAAASTVLQIDGVGTIAPKGYIFQLTMANAADTAEDITVLTGEATDEGGTDVIVLTANITKQINAAWSVGTDAGGLNTGSVAAGWYEVHLIKRIDTGVVDVMFTTTANRATLPANYTLQRRIGWVKRNAGNTSLEQFTQINDWFTWTTQFNDASITATATAAAVTVTVPPNAIGRFRIASDSNTDNAVNQVTVFSEIVEGSVTPSDTTGIASIGAHDIAGAQAGHIELRVSATSTIEHDSSHTANVVDVSTYGYIDHRRRLGAV